SRSWGQLFSNETSLHEQIHAGVPLEVEVGLSNLWNFRVSAHLEKANRKRHKQLPLDIHLQPRWRKLPNHNICGMGSWCGFSTQD
ncbi:hypothetical protein JRQ81_005902, partial [Phrynocephalus forsythii]